MFFSLRENFDFNIGCHSSLDVAVTGFITFWHSPKEPVTAAWW